MSKKWWVGGGGDGGGGVGGETLHLCLLNHLLMLPIGGHSGGRGGGWAWRRRGVAAEYFLNSVFASTSIFT